MATLTPRQLATYEFVVDYIKRHRVAPTFEEIGQALELRSLASVFKHLEALEKKGFIRRGQSSARSIEILREATPEEREPLEAAQETIKRLEKEIADLRWRLARKEAALKASETRWKAWEDAKPEVIL